MNNNATDKPLPIIPKPQENSYRLTTTLSVESRNHARQFILRALEEENAVIARNDWDSEKDSWATGLLDALDVLGEHMANGGWLAGIRRSRKAGILRKTSVNERKNQPPTQDDPEMDAESPADASNESSSQSIPSEQALTQLRVLLSKLTLPSPKPAAKHMLLTTGAFGTRNAIPIEDTGFDLIPSSVGCVFTPNFFLMPWSSGTSTGKDVASGVVLFGLEEWDVDSEDSEENPTRVVGGNFSFKGVTSVSQHLALCKILRLSIYIHLSLILEQHLLSDSHVKLKLPKQRPPRALPPPPEPPQTPSDYPRRAREPASPSAVWSFFSRKTEDLFSRATGFRSEIARRDSTRETAHHPNARPSQDHTHHQRTRTFSFLPDSISWTAKVRKEVDEFATGPPFRTTVQRIQKSQDLLSTTAGLTFPLPALLTRLADQEDRDPTRRPTGYERFGLNSVLGWEGRDSRGKGMAGIQGFVRHQEICILYSEHVVSRSRSASSVTASEASSGSSTISSVTTSTTDTTVTNNSSTQCGGRPRWMLFQYYSRRKGAEKTLGETLVRMCSVAEDPCGNAGCQSKRGDHELRFIHAGVRIAVHSEPLEVSYDDDYIEMWESCQCCGEETKPHKMSDGTFLLSFGKYLELLVYSPKLHDLHPTLCEHTSSSNVTSLTSDPRLNILRHFSYQTQKLTFSLSVIEDVFDVHVPRLQLLKASNDKPLESTSVTSPALTAQNLGDADEAKRALRKEIVGWWQEVSDYVERLEILFASDDLRTSSKSLPRLPSADEAFDDFDGFDLDVTPKAAAPPLPVLEVGYFDLSSRSLPDVAQKDESPTVESGSDDSATSSALTTPIPQTMDNLQLLSSMRHDFQRDEQLLYGQLSRTPVAHLNNVRRSFIASSRGAIKRLSAWEKKHVPKGAAIAPALATKQPSWWAKDCHAVPGGSVIVREDDWGSIIAFTLSSQDYVKELAGMFSGKANFQSAPPPISSEPRPSMFTRPSYRLFSSSRPLPDPDDGRVVWHEEEGFSAVISRKEHPRDPSALLSLRDVLRKAPLDLHGLAASRFAMPSRVATPPSAWAKPAVEISMESVVGQVEVPEREAAIEKKLQDMGSSDGMSSRGATSGSSTPSSSMIFEGRGRKASFSHQSEITIRATENGNQPKDPTKVAFPDTKIKEPEEEASPSFMVSSLTGGLTQVMRYMLNTNDQRPESPTIKKYKGHGLLSLDSPAIDDRPHIKYDWTIGKRLKFSCTVYYARQFDALRRRCGIEDVFLKSLERSENWMAEGGKSRSNFWKTGDDRFIIKTLVNAWNVADLQVLIELGPSYFRYMDSTVKKPTVLAKLLGFYTVEIRNLETGNTQSKADLLVMENLFYDKNIVKTFDLKGIQGRRVKANSKSSTGNKTLFDGEWIEGQQRALTLLHPHAKIALQDAIKSDSEYLSKANIMDYSLLLGIDVEHKQIACGLVDTIGSYTFAKTLEYKAKQNLKSGKDVTVIPPAEYQQRFISAMDEYFLACPNKWSKPLDDTKIISDPNLLPSVL